MSKHDISWVAGILEGEGYFLARPDQSDTTIGLQMTDLDVVQKVQEIVGMGTISTKEREGKKTIYDWRIYSKEEVMRFGRYIYPYLFERRQQQLAEVLRLAQEKIENVKISEEDVLDIYKRAHLRGETQKSIAEDYGITAEYVSQIKLGKVKSDITGHNE